jgi:catalase
MLKHFYLIDEEYGDRIAKKIGVNIERAKM